MVAANEIYRVADELMARRKLVSVRKVRERLPDPKGSHEDINPLLDRWKRERNYRPRLAQVDLSEPMEKALAVFARQVRAAETVLGQELAECRAENDALKRQVEHLTAENAALSRGPAQAVPEKGQPVPGRQPKERRYGISQATSLAFWDLLMREIVKLLGNRTMTLEEIVDAIDPLTKEYAAEHFTPLLPGVVNEAMGYRIRRGHYFVVDDGLFRRKPGARGRRKRNLAFTPPESKSPTAVET